MKNLKPIDGDLPPNPLPSYTDDLAADAAAVDPYDPPESNPAAPSASTGEAPTHSQQGERHSQWWGGALGLSAAAAVRHQSSILDSANMVPCLQP